MLLRSPEVKLIDFDEVVIGEKQRQFIVGSNQYRAPEICMGELLTAICARLND